MNDKKLIHRIALKHRDRIFSEGLTDLTKDSIDFATSVMKELSEHNIDSIGMTGWLKIPNYEERFFIMYVKIKLNNKQTIYLDIFNGENIIYNKKMKSLKKNKNPKNKN